MILTETVQPKVATSWIPCLYPKLADSWQANVPTGDSFLNQLFFTAAVFIESFIWVLDCVEKCFGWVCGTQTAPRAGLFALTANWLDLVGLDLLLTGILFTFLFLFTRRWNPTANKRAERPWTSHEEHIQWLDKAECVDQQEQQQLHRAAVWQHYHRERVCTLSQGTEAPMLRSDWAFESSVQQENSFVL